MTLLTGWWARADRGLRTVMQNAGTMAAGHGVAGLLEVATLAVAIRAIGAGAFGVLILVQAYVEIVDRLVNFQSWQGLIKFGAEELKRADEGNLRGLVKSGMVLDVVSSLAGWIIALLAAGAVGAWLGWDGETVALARLYSLTILVKLTDTPTAMLRLFDRFDLLAWSVVAVSFLKLLAVVLAVMSGAGLISLLVIWMAADAVRSLAHLALGLWQLHRRRVERWWQARAWRWRELLSFSLWTNLASTADLPVKQLDVFIVSKVVSLEAVAILKIIKSVSQVLAQIGTPIYQALFPQFSLLVAERRSAEAFHLLRRIAKLSLAFGFPLVLALGASSPLWLGPMFGEEVAAAWQVLAVYLALRLVSISFIGIHPLFISMGFARQNFQIVVLTNALYLVTAWLLASWLGLMGIVLAYGMQFSLVLLLKSLTIRRSMPTSSPV